MASRLTDGFREIIELRWYDFAEMASSVDATNFDSILTAIVLACRKGNLRAIQTGLDRLDGKIATEIEVEYPKFYMLFPYAEKAADDPSIIDLDNPGPRGHEKAIRLPSGDIAVPHGDNSVLIGAPADMDELHAMEEELPTGSLRAVLEKMLDSPKSTVSDIIATSERVDAGDLSAGNPKVKSVIVAGLMKLVHEGKIGAVFEVFDQIDGKVAEKFKVLGQDVFVKRFDRIAPAGAVKNADGIYQIEAPIMTDAWTAKLESGRKR